MSSCFVCICFKIDVHIQDCAGVKARNGRGEEGLVPENYIRVWNPVDDVGDSDMNEVSVDNDDILLGRHALASPHNRLAYSESKLYFVSCSIYVCQNADQLTVCACIIACMCVCFVCLHTYT